MEHFMSTFFHRKEGILHVEGLSIPRLCQIYETPFYLVSQGSLEERAQAFQKEMKLCQIDGFVHFAVKACSNIAVLKILEQSGCGADIVSVGEMRRAREAGISPEKIIFSGVGKTKKELREALIFGVGQYNIECLGELEVIAKLTQELGVVARVGVRVNPDIFSDTHHSIATGKGNTKFGIPLEQVIPLACKIHSMESLKLCDLSLHIGSNITKPEPFKKAFSILATLVKTLKEEHKIILESVDVGGGLGNSSSFRLKEFMKIVQEAFRGLDVKVLFEPGRWLCSNSALLVMSVLHIKHMGEILFVIADAGMNDFMRPVLYGAEHPIVHVDRKDTQEHRVTVTGPICETGDYLAKDIMLPLPKRGDALALFQAGAYGSVLSSTMNGRPLTAEVLVKGKQHALIREPNAESWRQDERQPPWIS